MESLVGGAVYLFPPADAPCFYLLVFLLLPAVLAIAIAIAITPIDCRWEGLSVCISVSPAASSSASVLYVKLTLPTHIHCNCLRHCLFLANSSASLWMSSWHCRQPTFIRLPLPVSLTLSCQFFFFVRTATNCCCIEPHHGCDSTRREGEPTSTTDN